MEQQHDYKRVKLDNENYGLNEMPKEIIKAIGTFLNPLEQLSFSLTNSKLGYIKGSSKREEIKSIVTRAIGPYIDYADIPLATLAFLHNGQCSICYKFDGGKVLGCKNKQYGHLKCLTASNDFTMIGVKSNGEIHRDIDDFSVSTYDFITYGTKFITPTTFNTRRTGEYLHRMTGNVDFSSLNEQYSGRLKEMLEAVKVGENYRLVEKYCHDNNIFIKLSNKCRFKLFTYVRNDMDFFKTSCIIKKIDDLVELVQAFREYAERVYERDIRYPLKAVKNWDFNWVDALLVLGFDEKKDMIMKKWIHDFASFDRDLNEAFLSSFRSMLYYNFYREVIDKARNELGRVRGLYEWVTRFGKSIEQQMINDEDLLNMGKTEIEIIAKVTSLSIIFNWSKELFVKVFNVKPLSGYDFNQLHVMLYKANKTEPHAFGETLLFLCQNVEVDEMIEVFEEGGVGGLKNIYNRIKNNNN